ncbi:hypothetical protein CPJCM30710_30970 [Clostridium polyendosporum]|uniref:4Fe-4S ferredoxin-type domain-containing protein n=1 Tax=Clostridium polyendosporum TaxID=69208 RepID=A0A919S302_9CLOT|nr:permease [Clostridium polyendosporum]GIM30431.1 hypothetical protein CPJCM30710_30970 [Clostridium polyendosporum]
MNVAKSLKKNKLLFLVVLTYSILLIVMPQKAIQSGKNSGYYVLEMMQIMPVIFILTSLIEAWVPRETIMKGFGENSGVKGAVFSFLLGSFSAGPVYAAFPVCKMLLKKGASISNVVIIISTWAVIKVPMLANESKFLGVKFMGIRWILTTISIFIMGYLVSSVVKKEDIRSEDKVERNKDGVLDVKEQYCIGCGLCTKLYPNTFMLVYGKAKVCNEEITPETKDQITNIIQKCPAKAIYFK